MISTAILWPLKTSSTTWTTTCATTGSALTTEPIELAGVELGPFEIRLEWTTTGDEPAYRVIAKDPHPAESNRASLIPT